MAHPGKSPVRIRSRISLADAALMRLEAKQAKGPAGLLVADDVPAARPAPVAEVASAETVSPASISDTAAPAPVAAAPAPSADVAARLEAALRGHLENVASALAADPAPARPESVGAASPVRSIYAPDPAARGGGIHLPSVAPLDMEPLPPPLAVALAPANATDLPEPETGRHEDEFGHAPFAWMADEREDDAAWDGEPLDEEALPDPADLDKPDEPSRRGLRRAWREPEPIGHLPPLVEPSPGVSARTLAFAALFGLAAGVGGIAAYQLTVAPVTTPAIVASATGMPVADTGGTTKLDADRVPASDAAPAVKLAAAGAVPTVAPSDRPAETPAAAVVPVATAEIPAAAPLSAPAQPAEQAAATAADASAVAAPDPVVGAEVVPPTLRKTGDPAASEEVPTETEPFVATAAVRAAPQRPRASSGQVLAYAPTPQPNDPVARSFFGKDDEPDAAPPKKSASKAPAPSPGKAKVLMAVNMRAKPDNDAPSIKILGAGTRVQVVACDMWCTVIADGKRGYVFKKFLDN